MSSSPPSFRTRTKLSNSAAVAVAPDSRRRTAVLRGVDGSRPMVEVVRIAVELTEGRR
jgi:hypothetical protein